MKKMQGGGAVAMPQQGGGGGGREGQVWLGAWRVAWHVAATGTQQKGRRHMAYHSVFAARAGIGATHGISCARRLARRG
ncbi:MAG: hypothetical protein CVT82_00695 [Alphaproteobacteria bacterium HGW-Alphaproteobacteria-4]|nr:MAG: hypothetical protein CVT82_00695 [Alphaproteobacteria bacterium HGW-Alphaproteobacteria-4]